MANEPEAEKEPAKKGGGGLLLVVVLVNTLALVGGGVYLAFFFKPALAAPAPVEAHAEPKEVGPLLELEPIVANLAEPGASRFLKVTMHLEVEDEEAKLALESSLVPIRSTALLYLSSLSTEDTMGTEKKEAVNAALLAKIEETLGSKAVRRIYFTEFVVQ